MAIKTNGKAVKAIVFRNSIAIAVATAYDDTVDNIEGNGWICVGNAYLNEVLTDE